MNIIQFNFKVLILLFFLQINPSFGQTNTSTFKFSGDFLLFIDSKNEIPILITEDYKSYKGYNFDAFQLDSIPKDIPLKDIIAKSLSNKTYLMDEGCGPVFLLDDDSLSRVDKTFRHRNQFNANVFLHDNKIHYFGGYGLFTDKNIITYFDESIGEWFERKIVSEQLPVPRSSAEGILLNEQLYIWGGAIKDKAIYSKELNDSYLWRLDLKSNSWSNIGLVAQLPKISKTISLSFQVDNKLYIITFDALFVIDVLNNEITEYEFNMPNILATAYNSNDGKVIIVNKNIAQQNNHITIIPLEELTKTLVSKSLFYKTQNSTITIYVVIGIILLIILVIVIYKTLFISTKQFYYSKSQNCFYFSNKPTSLEADIHSLLVFMLDYQENYILLDKVNELFAKNDTNESHITINKRRDQSLKKLRFKLSTLLEVPENQVIVEQRIAVDKRVKEIRLGVPIKITK